MLKLPVRLAQQALDRDGRLETAVLQRLQHTADHPPELMHVVANRRSLQRGGDLAQRLQMAGNVFATNPAEQRQLKLRAYALCQLHRVFAAALAGFGGFFRAVRGQVEQQQRAFGQ